MIRHSFITVTVALLLIVSAGTGGAVAPGASSGGGAELGSVAPTNTGTPESTGVSTAGEANEPPTARDDSVTVYPGTSRPIDVLANDDDADGEPNASSVRVLDGPTEGSVTVLENGSVRYSHGVLAGYQDSFTYVVDDDDGAVSNVATVSVTVTKDAGRDGDLQTTGVSTSGTFSSGSDFSAVKLLSGYNQPVAFTFLPDDRMLLLQKNGEIFLVNATESPVVAEPYMTIPDVATRGERGLLDIALDPNFTENGYFYVYYTNSTTDRNRISRFTHVEKDDHDHTHSGEDDHDHTHSGGFTSEGDPSSESVLWENPDDTEGCCHFGGGLDVGPDGKLYATTGEEFEGAKAQNLSLADGKIIRINRDGTVPSSNPFVGEADALDEIYAYGLRNPYRANFDRPTGRLFIGEVGGNNNSAAQEDIHVGESGANYGWPECQGNCENPNYSDPVFTYPHAGSGAAVTAGPVYRGDQFPLTYDEALFYSDYVRGWIKYLTFNSSGGVESSNDFYASDDAVVFVGQGPDGALYYTGIVDGTLYRINYSGNQPPDITEASANVTSGSPPLTVSFTGGGTDLDGDDLTYTWVFDDGTEAVGPNATHTYDEAGRYDAYLEVTDGNATVTSDRIRIQVGSPPNVDITSPANGSLFRAGETLTFEAVASDPEDGALNDSQYDWELTFLHNEHTHPGFKGVNGGTAAYTIPEEGHDYSGDTGYMATVTVTDSDGLTDSANVSVFPDKVDLTFRTEPSGLSFKLDSIQRQAPYVHDTAIDFRHTVEAPATQCLGGTEYGFSNWSDGGARVHEITVPESDRTYTARYMAAGPCDDLVTEGLVAQYESGSGVSTSGGAVTGWADQSGRGNDLSAEGEPTLVTGGTPSGAPAISFDGDGDALVRSVGVDGIPIDDENRSVFLVASYQSPGFGGFTWGRADPNRAFGTAVNDAGELTVQGWGPANDYPSGVQGTGAGWLTQSVVHADGQFSHYRNGTRIDTGTQTFATSDDEIVLGAEIGRSPYLDMEVGAVLVYDRALSDVERRQVEQYLRQTYLNATGGNVAPTARDDDATVTQGGTVAIDVLANDADADGSLDASTVTVVDRPTNGSVVVNASTGVVTYTHDGSGATTDEFSYTVADDDGAVSDRGTVAVVVSDENDSFPVSTNGLVVRLESDRGISTSGSDVTGWADQSGRGNDLSAEGDPTLVSGGTPTGAPAISFDGDGDALTRIGSLNGLPVDDGSRSVFLVASYQSPGFGGFTWGQADPNEAFGTVVNDAGELTVQGWRSTNDYPSGVQGTGAGWLTQSVVHADSRFVHYRNGTRIDTANHTFATRSGEIVLGAEIGRPPYLDMEVAAVLVFDRALSDAERRQVEQYLRTNYVNASARNDPPTAAVTASPSPALVGQTVTFDASGSMDADGSVVEYRWDVGADGTVDATTSAPTFNESFASAGTRNVSVTVVDDDGATDAATATVAVDPAVTKLVDVGLEGAPDGLASYTITVRAEGGEVRSIEQVTPADGRFRVQAGGVDETFAEVFAYDSERSVGPFDGRRTLFEVTVVGRPGMNATAEVNSMVDDSRSDIDPARLSVEVANASGSPFDAPVPGAGTTARPTDPDGDGLYEDVDGNGAFRFPDVVALLFADYGTINGDVDRQAALDFDGDGSVGFLDVVDLLFRL
jgi:glucose/arabinose dehydrogenase